LAFLIAARDPWTTSVISIVLNKFFNIACILLLIVFFRSTSAYLAAPFVDYKSNKRQVLGGSGPD
jgi:hypothetical protein